MNTNKILLGGLTGGVASFLFGFLIWALLLDGIMESHNTAPAGVMKEPMLMWALILGNLAYGFLFALIFGRWANISTLRTGAIAGAVIGLVIGIYFDFMTYSMLEVMDMTGIIIDILASGVHGALIGGAVAWVLGRGREMMAGAA